VLLEPLAFFSGEIVARVGVNQIIFDRKKTLKAPIVREVRLLEFFPFLLGEFSQQIQLTGILVVVV
jgi:hypothetical protein